MRPQVLDLLACPGCGGDLGLEASRTDGDEVIEGKLGCDACGRRYPIHRGIPRMLPDAERVSDEAQRTVDRFGAQWNDFDFIGPHYEQQFLGWIAPNQPDTFAGKTVLEGGCGKGRHSILAARWGAKDVLAIDLGSAVEAAYRNSREHPNVHVIQGDLFHLPVKKDAVDVAFSVGVLHHTPEPRGAFLELVKHVRPGGKMIAWIYGAENNEWITRFVDPVRKQLTSRLPHRAVYQLSKLPAALVWGVGRGVYQPLSRPPLDAVGRRLFYQAYINVISQFPFDEVHSIVHDHLTPPIANYIPRADFEEWWRAGGLERVTIGWHNENSWRGTGYKPERAEAAAERS
jgi:uncharacterized protein YbaR (Trm112 family)/protein-L-isoaspartate O-methyltransferase